jgi:hypothetical protein
MTDSGPNASLAVQRQRFSRREEFAAQVRLVAMLAEHLDPASTYWTSLENRPRSPMSGVFQRMRGCRPGVPDLVVIQRGPGSVLIVFVELKSRRGVASKAQKQARAEMLPSGAVWIMARSPRAAMEGLHRAGVQFRRSWEPQQLEPWEGPFFDPNQRLPQEPGVRAERRASQQRWRERQRACKAAQLAAESAARDQAA